MGREENSLELVGLEPAERLLSDDLDALPAAVKRPETLPESSARRRLVGLGATLTGVTLIGGVALIILGVVDAIAGGLGGGALALLLLGIALVSTHWGWVHVAEVSANALEHRHNHALLDRRRIWLAEIAPYTRWEVSTDADRDGAITILTTRHRPVRCGDHAFTFVREITSREVHSGDEPAATVAERAELLRRQAAASTEQERMRYEAANDAYESARLAHADEEQRRAAVRAASEALSAQINSNLRDPPLIE
jgi:hypothetical protein